MYPNTNNRPTTSLESGLPSVGSLVWAAGRTRAQQAINLYANLDYLRPYFDVEPKQVVRRLIQSFLPKRIAPDANLKPELYGPSMIVFTLAAILIYQMKLSSHAVQDGTLIGTSFLVCFGYWIGSSVAMSSVSFICNTHLTLMQILSINGYALFSHCVVLFLATFIHTSHDHLLFYSLWAVLGGVAALRMSVIVMCRTLNPRYRLLLGLFVFAVHMFFLLYLHFAYHTLAETVAHALNDEAAAAAASAVATSPVAVIVTETIVNKTKEITAKTLVRQIRENIVVVANQSNVTRPI